jgi:ubiquitin C-terminal hydrolase
MNIYKNKKINMEGITNLGGTCAINSILQIIIRNKYLRSIILNSNTPSNTLTNELKEIVDLIHNQNKSITPNKFINFFYETFKGIFNKNEEIDINELWIFLYNKIFEETSVHVTPPTQITSIYDKHDYDIYIHNHKKTSEITNTVQGSYLNIIQCNNCKYNSYSFEPFISMPLDIIENQSIANLIIKTLLHETRDADDWKCEKCNQKCSYIKMKKIWKMPKILFISLNRFNEMFQKNNSNIYINDNINFNVESIETVTTEQKYNIQSMGLHYGNLLGGHYTALCYLNDEFYLYNDNNVNKFTKEDIYEQLKNNNSAYLIVYELNC